MFDSLRSRNISEEIILNENAVDQISEMIDRFLEEQNTDRSTRFRIRLSMEEAMLRWIDRFGHDHNVRIEISKVFNYQTITLMLEGDPYNPLATSENDLGEWAESLYTGISLDPTFQYRKGMNILQLKMRIPDKNPALRLLVFVLIGTFIGLLGKYVFPDALRLSLLQMVLEPIQTLFVRILNLASAPIIFLSVIAVVCEVGQMTSIGQSGRRMISRFLLYTFIETLAVSVLAVFFSGLKVSPTDFTTNEFSGVLDFFIQYIPNDALNPFIEGNSPQLILLALVLGNALNAAGPMASSLRKIVTQADNVGVIIAGWVSRIAPFFISVLLILGFWNGSVSRILIVWQPLLIGLLLSIILLVTTMFYVSKKLGVPVRLLAVKMKPSFLTAFRNSSVDAAQFENTLCCEDKLGISTKLTSFGIPMGLITYMPSACIFTSVIVLFSAKLYHVQIDTVWFLTAILLSVSLISATPPVAGIGLLTYLMLFTQLGIPKEALTMALFADIISGFASCAINQAMLQMELLLEAKTLNLVNENRLKKEE